MKSPTLQHKFKFKLHGHSVTMQIMAYRKLSKEEIDSCVIDYVRSLKKKRLKNDVIITWETIFGATDSI